MKQESLIQEARKIDKFGLFLKLLGWVIIFIGGVWFSVTVFQTYLQDFLATRPLAIYGGALIAIAIGFIIQHLGTKRMNKQERKIENGGGGYK